MFNSSLNSSSNSDEINRYLNSIFILLFFLIGLPWNAIVIGIVLKKKLYSHPSVMLILNLAISNFLVCLLIMPPIFIFGLGDFGDADIFDEVCQVSFLHVLLPTVSSLTITLLSVDRVIYLRKPLTYHSIVTPWKAFEAIIVTWIISIVASLPPLFMPELVEYSPNSASCILSVLSTPWYFIALVVIFVVLTLVQFVGCGCIIYMVRAHLIKKLRGALDLIVRTQAPLTQRSNLFKDYNKSQLRLVVVFGAIFTTGLVTLLPVVLIAIFVTIPSYDPPSFLHSTSFILLWFRSVIYPIIEVTLTHEIRSAVSELCSDCMVRCKP